MSLRCVVQIRIESKSGEESTAIAAALEPDNIEVPQGMSISTKNHNKSAGAADVLEIIITGVEEDAHGNYTGGKYQSPGRVIAKMAGAMDEMLGHVQVAQRILR